MHAYTFVGSRKLRYHGECPRVLQNPLEKPKRIAAFCALSRRSLLKCRSSKRNEATAMQAIVLHTTVSIFGLHRWLRRRVKLLRSGLFGRICHMDKNAEAFHAPLHPKDTEMQTFGCRHTLPRICGKHYMPKKCAFVNADSICYAPPQSWPKQFLKLKKKP